MSEILLHNKKRTIHLFQYYEYKLKIAHEVQSWMKSLVGYATEIFNTISEAESIGAGLLSAGRRLIGDAVDFVKKNIIHIKELCMQAGQ